MLNEKVKIYVLLFILGYILVLTIVSTQYENWIAPKTPILGVKFIFKQTTPLDGSTLFWQDGVLIKPILKRTRSHLTHAAIILNGYVYEAVPPRVHKVPLNDYIKHMKKKSQKRSMQKRGFTWFILQPKESYTQTEINLMLKYANSQLGRRYMIRGFDKRLTRGIFCSMYAANILEQGGRIKSSSFHESPGSLYKKLEGIYQ